jgi:hypothetical protein
VAEVEEEGEDSRPRHPTQDHKKKIIKKKSISNWSYYLGSAKQALEFKATTKFLINCIKQNFEFGNDAAMAIINQKPISTKIWKPTMQFSRNCWSNLGKLGQKLLKNHMEKGQKNTHQYILMK